LDGNYAAGRSKWTGSLHGGSACGNPEAGRLFTVLPETSAIYPAWKRLVFENQVSGKQAYDARLVAAMQVHNVTSILTFNPSDFRRYTGIEVFEPATVAGSGGP
jgi:hypothetical protein